MVGWISSFVSQGVVGWISSFVTKGVLGWTSSFYNKGWWDGLVHLYGGMEVHLYNVGVHL